MDDKKVPEWAKARCGNCMAPYNAHRPRMSAAPTCPTGGGAYHEATERELEDGYQAAFPDGLKPIATFRADDPASLEHARSVLSPEALDRYFGPEGEGVEAWMEAVERTARKENSHAG
jgi:hypothetical protein|tara:strand:+ start:465 stop:818 length:354 start_codon:yes stop_codon:yes gene_type:complete